MNCTVIKAKSIINIYYKEIKSGKEIAQKANCNYHTLRAEFVRETGYTLMTYLNKIRCMYAVIYLIKKNWKLYKLALEVGFTDEKYFIRVFKKFYGTCPMQLRKLINN